MRIFALELDNDIKGIARRDAYTEGLIAKLPSPDLVVLPELSRPSYMASRKIWNYADDGGRSTSEWAVRTAKRYDTYIGVGYLDREDGHYYNRYMIAGPEGYAALFPSRRGNLRCFAGAASAASSGRPSGMLAWPSATIPGESTFTTM